MLGVFVCGQAIAEAARGSTDGPSVPPALLAASGVLETAPASTKPARKHPFCGESPSHAGEWGPDARTHPHAPNPSPDPALAPTHPTQHCVVPSGGTI